MSNEALTWAFKQSTGNAGRKAVLVALADAATEGHVTIRKQSTLAQMTDQSERAVRDHLAALERMGLIERSHRYSAGRRGADEYRLPVSVMARVHPPQPAEPAATQPADLAATGTDNRQILPPSTGKSRRALTQRTTTQEPSSSEAPPRRDDVEKLCTQLADRIEANGSNRPTITARWRDAARLMIDRDHREPEKIAKAIDWCQADEFWRANILSMPKLRDKYDQLRLAAQRARTAAPARDFDAEREAARLARQRARFSSTDSLAGAR